MIILKKIFITILVLSILITSTVFANSTVKKTEDNEEIVISLGGDIMFDRGVKKNINKYGIEYPFSGVRDIFKKDDITFLNLETSITNISKPANPKKEYNFASDPKTAKELKNSSVEIVSLSNNHSMDYGHKGFVDTMNYLDDAEVLYVGGGRNYEEALKYKIIEVKGKKIGFLGYNRVIPSSTWRATKDKAGQIGLYDYEIDKMLPYIKDVKSKVDYLLLAVHWQGMPTENIPKKFTIAGHKLIDAGVDVVVGTHPHVMQATEFYKNGVIFYSLGNFIFDNPSPRQIKTAIVQLEISPKDLSTKIKYIPCKSINTKPIVLEGKERIVEIKYMNKLNSKFNSFVQEDGYLIRR